MFKKSTTNKQLGLFTSASSLMCKRESKQYENEKEWHMQFYRNVTCNIDEDVFRPLFDEKMGCPTKAIRQLVAMSILKEGAGCSDETLYENCRYNLLWRAALGLFNIDDQCPAISSYYHLRKLICDYEETVFDASSSRNSSAFRRTNWSDIRDATPLSTLLSNVLWMIS